MESAEIKAIISEFVKSYGVRISEPPTEPYREYPLVVGPHKYFADCAFQIDNAVWLFIEDDEGQSSTGNASKYWHWIEENKIGERVHLIQIIGPSYESHKQLSQFLCGKAMQQFPNFVYHQILTNNWDSYDWRDDLKDILIKILIETKQ